MTAPDQMGQAAYAAALAVDRFHQRLHVAASTEATRPERAAALLGALTQWPMICREIAALQQAAPTIAAQARRRLGADSGFQGDGRMSNWFCLSSFDPVTSAALLRQAGYVAYCPQELVTKRRGRKVSDIKRPLWPGYLFACCEPQHLGAALVLGDATDFLRYTDSTGSRGPLRMRDSVLVPVIMAEMFGALDFTDKTPATYKPAKGDRVRITAGVFRDYLAKVTSVSKNTVKLAVENGGQMTAKIKELKAA